MLSFVKENTLMSLAVALAAFTLPTSAMYLGLWEHPDFKGATNGFDPMPVNGCYSDRPGGSWRGFPKDTMSSIRVSGGCCRLYRDKDCGGLMVTVCNEDIPDVRIRFGDGIDNQLSSVYCHY